MRKQKKAVEKPEYLHLVFPKDLPDDGIDDFILQKERELGLKTAEVTRAAVLAVFEKWEIPDNFPQCLKQWLLDMKNWECKVREMLGFTEDEMFPPQKMLMEPLTEDEPCIQTFVQDRRCNPGYCSKCPVGVKECKYEWRREKGRRVGFDGVAYYTKLPEFRWELTQKKYDDGIYDHRHVFPRPSGFPEEIENTYRYMWDFYSFEGWDELIQEMVAKTKDAFSKNHNGKDNPYLFNALQYIRDMRYSMGFLKRHLIPMKNNLDAESDSRIKWKDIKGIVQEAFSLGYAYATWNALMDSPYLKTEHGQMKSRSRGGKIVAISRKSKKEEDYLKYYTAFKKKTGRNQSLSVIEAIRLTAREFDVHESTVKRAVYSFRK